MTTPKPNSLPVAFPRHILTILVLMSAPALLQPVAADEPAEKSKETTSSSSDKKAAARLKYMIKGMGQFNVIVEDEAESPALMVKEASLRWSNPISNVIDGVMVVYAQDPRSRPAVIGQYHVHGNGFQVNEFSVVHPGKIEFRIRDRTFWAPKERYGKFAALPKAPKPAMLSAALRLVQMKRMAERFSVVDEFSSGKGDLEKHVLRLMPRPIYRYGLLSVKPTEKKGKQNQEVSNLKDGEILDGALFSFVLATDPEANLLVEIYQKGGTPTWRYALFPMTIYSLEAKLDNKTVWNKPEALIFNSFSHPHFAGPYRGDSGGVNIKSLLP